MKTYNIKPPSIDHHSIEVVMGSGMAEIMAVRGTQRICKFEDDKYGHEPISYLQVCYGKDFERDLRRGIARVTQYLEDREAKEVRSTQQREEAFRIAERVLKEGS